MMGKMRCVIVIAVLVIGVFLITGKDSFAADNVIKWKCQTYWPVSSPSYEQSGRALVELIKERTDGKLIIETFPESAIIPSKDIYSAVSKGMLEMGSIYPGYIRNKVPLASIAGGLPYMFQNEWECSYFHKKLGFEKMMRNACAKDGIFYSTDCIAKVDLVTKKPIRALKDLKGIKLRSSGEFQIWFTDLGAAAAYLPGGEVYAALASGVIEGVHWGGVQGSSGMSFYELCKFSMKPSIGVSGYNAWVINQKAIDKLPKDIRDIFYLVLEEHFWSRTNEYTYLEKIEVSKMEKEQGVEFVTLPVEEQKAMYAAAIKIWDKVAAQSPECAEAFKILKSFLTSMGYI